MKNEKVEAHKKQAYEKPSMRIVLINDSVQVLGIGCKSTAVTASGGPTTNPCIPGVRCNQPGS